MDGGRRLVPSQIGCGDLEKGGLAGDGRLSRRPTTFSFLFINIVERTV